VSKGRRSWNVNNTVEKSRTLWPLIEQKLYKDEKINILQLFAAIFDFWPTLQAEVDWGRVPQ
jgi:hypothetical protein